MLCACFLAIFFWFVAYNAVEAFFTLYAKNHLLMNEADGARLLGQIYPCYLWFLHYLPVILAAVLGGGSLFLRHCDHDLLYARNVFCTNCKPFTTV